MGVRGRHSGAELSVVTTGKISCERRQEAPSDLTHDQAIEWKIIVDRLPADWIQDEMRAILSAYCRHVVSMRRVAQLVQEEESSEEFDIMRYDKLLQMQEREGRALSSLATRLRLTPQATYDEKRKKPNKVKKPWAD